MIKTLTVGIPDKDNQEQLNIIGTKDDTQFNKIVVLAVGQVKIAVESQQLAQALSEVVQFQTPTPKLIYIDDKGVDSDRY